MSLDEALKYISRDPIGVFWGLNGYLRKDADMNDPYWETIQEHWDAIIGVSTRLRAKTRSSSST